MIKYPKTPRSHVILQNESIYSKIKKLKVIIEEKVDGSNAAISFDSNFNLILQSRGHILRGDPRERQFDLFKQWANQNIDDLFEKLETRYMMFGEWCYAKHRVFYDNLPSYFLEFDIYDKIQERFLSTEKRLNIIPKFVSSVYIIHTDILDKINNFNQFIGKSIYKKDGWREKLVEIAKSKGISYSEVWNNTDSMDLVEGLYIKVESEDFVENRMKLLRPNFIKVKDDSRWMNRPIIPNQLKESK